MRNHLLGILLFLIPISSFSQTRESFAVYFDFDRFALTKEALIRLDSFCSKNTTSIGHLEFEIKGYCDNRGTDDYNHKLSDKRVVTVKDYLLRKGMNSKFLISALGYGETEPVNENKTEEERQMNRRVDISILKKNADQPSATEEKKSLKQKIADSATTSGTQIVLRNINFVGGMHQFLPESEPMLVELLEAMQAYPKLVIRVEGHICCQEGNADGKDLETGFNNLSEARARAVMDYLLSNGIEPGRVSYKGFGHSAPLYSFPEETEEEKTQNRRVEIKIIRK